MRTLLRGAMIVAAAVVLLLPVDASAQGNGPAFAIANQPFWDYYQHRGGFRTFGDPISREFTLQGFRVQLFQRAAFQLNPDGSVSTMNLLDRGMMPYDSFNFSVVPAPDPELIAAAPSPTDPDYATRAIDFVRANAPDSWNGLAVNFSRTFGSTALLEDAFPNGDGNQGLLPLLNLELWGLPTSRPAYDPANHGFVYQRFQRGIMHFDASSGATQGLLLGGYLKAIMSGLDLPQDLRLEAIQNPLYGQYNPSSEKGPLRPSDLPGSDLGSAFRPGWGDRRFGVIVSAPGLEDDSRYVAAATASLGAGSWYSFGRGGASTPGRVELVRPGADMAEVARRALGNPGAPWIVGNEPNVPGQDDIKPAAYSDFLNRVATTVKDADPSALLVGPNVLNWDRTCSGCPGYAAGHLWSDAFVADYEARYGPLPLDAWGMHTYSLDWDKLPLVDSAADQAQLLAAREWLDSSGIGLPIWLTEFGVIWGFEGIDWIQQPGGAWLARPSGGFRDDLVGRYLDNMLSWLSGPDGHGARVERWFVYATSPAPEPYATRNAGISLLEQGKLTRTPLGERYQARAVPGG